MADDAYKPLVEEQENDKPAEVLIDEKGDEIFDDTAAGVTVKTKSNVISSNADMNDSVQKYHSFGPSGAAPMQSTLATDIDHSDANSNASNESVWDEDDYDVLNNIVSRNYPLLFFLTAFGSFVGMIIYVITNKGDYIWLGGCVGFAIAFLIDLSAPRKPFKLYYKDDLIVGEPRLQKWYFVFVLFLVFFCYFLYICLFLWFVICFVCGL